MSRQVVVMRLESLSKLAIAAALASLTAACGSDTLRFGENPFSNPFSAASAPQRDPAVTGNVQRAQPQNGVQSQPLPPPTYPTGVASAPLAAPSAQRMAAQPSAPENARGVLGSANGWSSEGGTAVTLRPGETIATLSNRYGVPATALLSVNGLTNANQATPGRQIIIPVYNASGASQQASAPQPSMAQSRTAAVEAAKAKVRPGQVAASDAAAKAAAAKAAAKVEPKVAAAKPEKAKPAEVVAKVVAPKPDKTKPVVEAKAPVEPAKPAAEPAETTASIDKSTTDFRWPARGRVIAGFNGKSNEGINISLPEGTPVKAAEGGTVAYSGSELKGYGNLVLIRHDNGFVSAYAHNGELNVKRGERVKRGQTIAKSGQSGNVSSPQLHFELRKGSTPVDPMQHLSGN